MKLRVLIGVILVLMYSLLVVALTTPPPPRTFPCYHPSKPERARARVESAVERFDERYGCIPSEFDGVDALLDAQVLFERPRDGEVEYLVHSDGTLELRPSEGVGTIMQGYDICELGVVHHEEPVEDVVSTIPFPW